MSLLAQRPPAGDQYVAHIAALARNPFPITVYWSDATFEVVVRVGPVPLARITNEALRRLQPVESATHLGRCAHNAWRTNAWPTPPTNVVLGDN